MPYTAPNIIESNLTSTEQYNADFGSTGVVNVHQITSPPPSHWNIDIPYDINLSQDPFDNILPIHVQDFAHHPTMDLLLYQYLL
jgi:hypothetical protein